MDQIYFAIHASITKPTKLKQTFNPISKFDESSMPVSRRQTPLNVRYPRLSFDSTNSGNSRLSCFDIQHICVQSTLFFRQPNPIFRATLWFIVLYRGGSCGRVGGFVFLDHFDQPNITPELFDVPPHPHVGLQTVTYLFEGEILHTDSLDNQQKISPAM